MRRDLQGGIELRRGLRNELLMATDWLVLRHSDQLALAVDTSLTPAQYDELLTYRQALRDWPVSGQGAEAFPGRPVWLR